MTGITYTYTPTSPPKRSSRLRSIGARLASERGGTLPAMAGASPEAETTRRTEHKKKIVLERKVGVPRDKGAGVQQVHKGKLELVRTVEGNVVQTGTIGVKVEPNGGTYVEIPVDDLLEAVKELADEEIKNPAAK